VFFSCCGLVWISSIDKIKIANQTILCGWKKNDMYTSEPNMVFYGFGFGLGWFGGFSIGLVRF